MLIRTIDRTPTGCPLFCEVTLLDKEGEELARKRIVYNPTDTDEMVIKALGVQVKGRPHTLRIKLLIEWIDNKPIRYQ
jgi:hypothetical protein